MFAEFLQWIDQGHCCNYNPGVYSNGGSITSWVKDGSSWPKYGPYMSTAISDEYLKEHNLCDGEPNKLLIKINTSELNIIKPSITNETNVKFSVRDFRETSSVNLQLKSPIQSGEDRKTYMFDISDQGLNEQFKNFYLHNRGISGRYGRDEFPALQAAKKVGEIVIVSNELTLDKVSVEDDRFPEWYGKSIQEISDDYNNDWRQVRDFMISRINTPLQDVDTTDYYDRNFEPNQRKITMRIHRDQWESVPGLPYEISPKPNPKPNPKPKKSKGSIGSKKRKNTSSNKKTKKRKQSGSGTPKKRKREKSKSIDSEPSNPDLKLMETQRIDKLATQIQKRIRGRHTRQNRNLTKKRYGSHKKPNTLKESRRRFLDHQRYLRNTNRNRDDGLSEYLQHFYFPQEPTYEFRGRNPNYDFYGDMEDYNPDNERVRFNEVENLYDDIM